MISRGYAVRIDRRTDVGRTEPLRARIETAAGIEHDVILKVSNCPGGSVLNLANEMLGALLAADLGLPVCEPFLVEMDEALIASVVPEALRTRLESSSSMAFASRDAGKQWRTWSQSADHLHADKIGMALKIIAFDAFIGNSDRAPHNANMLIFGDEWRLIDHESAFGFRMKLFPKCEPWTPGNLDLLCKWGQWSEHIFARSLKKKQDLDFSAVKFGWADLSDVRLSQYDACLPEEWEDARNDFSDALRHIRHVRDNIDQCVAELSRVLK